MLQKILMISLFLVTAVYAQNADKYEPNNDFLSAYSISFGDSVLVNASVFGTDTVVTDPSLCDIDYYRIALDSGKIVQFSIFPFDFDCFDFGVGMNFQLFDSSRVLMHSDVAIKCPVDGMAIPGYVVTKTGTYYLRIRKSTNPYNGPATNYGLSVHQRDNQNILSVLSPKGGETFSGGEYVTVKWQHDSTLFTNRDIKVQYSIDNGKSWRNAWYENLFDSVTSEFIDNKWRIPHLKYRTDQALVRVLSRNIPNASFGISKGTFTILASKNDIYEPNDDFSTARAITLGDSVVENGIVMKGYTERDSSVIDTTLTDIDFFKIYLEAGKHVTIENVFFIGKEEVYWENEYDNMFNSPPVMSLYDASKNQIGLSFNSTLTCGISHSGMYYCKVVPGEGDDYWNRYSLSIRQSDPITIVSPKGGEHFHTGQKMQINWTSDSTLRNFELFFSVNNGLSWKPFSPLPTGANSASWLIPALKNRTDQALIKVEISDVVNPLSGSSNPFTILSAPADAYEPNNDRASAYPIALGDSIIKNASIFKCEDSTALNSDPKYSWSDIDNYKVNLTAEALIHIQSWPDTTGGAGGLPDYLFYNTGDSSGIIPASLLKRNRNNKMNQFFHVNQSGVYNLEVYPFRWTDGDYGKYGFSIKSMGIIAFRSFVLDTDYGDSTQSFFSGHYTDDFTKLTFYFSQKKNNFVEIRTMLLSPDAFPPLTDELLKVKCLAVFCDNGIDNQNSTKISIPYDPADLNGYPESSLALAYQDFMKSDQFLPVRDSIDTINHRINVRLPYLQCGILQVYIKSDVAVNNLVKGAPVSGIKTRYLRPQKNLAINLSLPASENVELRLYNILGKCVQKRTFKAVSGYSTHLWSLKELPNGKYVLAIKAGKYRKQETFMVLY